MEPTKKQIRRWRRYLADERMESATYQHLANRQPGTQREIMLELARAENRHEQYWMDLLGDHAFPPPRPSFGARVTSWLAASFGSVFVLALAQRSEQRHAYDHDVDAPDQMAADEHIHGEVVRSLAAESRAQMAGSFRAAIFGANDGLVSNLALILGVAASGMDPHLVIITGLSGLLAGALSMAAGEWISVSSQRELLEASRPDPEAHRSIPALDVDANELALLFRARGETSEEAAGHAREILSEGVGTVALLAPKVEAETEAIGTPWQAAISSFLFFGIGATVPLIPFLCGMVGLSAILASAGVVGLVLLVTGGLVGLLSGRPAWWGGLRQLLIGYGAAGITYLIGSLFGA